MPAASTAVAWTNTSLPPPSGEINPYPFAVLKNLTVPTAITSPASSLPAEATCQGAASAPLGLEEGRLSRPSAQRRIRAKQARFIERTPSPQNHTFKSCETQA